MIAENIAKIRTELPEGVKLIAVSKLKPVERQSRRAAQGYRVAFHRSPSGQTAEILHPLCEHDSRRGQHRAPSRG